MRVLGTAAIGLSTSMFACSTSSPPSAAAPSEDDAAVDGSAGDDAGGMVGTDLPMCGPPPYVTVGIVVRAASTGGDGSLVSGAKLTTSLCPGTLRVSGDDGVIRGRVSKGVPFYPRFEAKNYAPTLIAELSFDADKDPIVAPLPPSLFTALIPGFGPTKTAIVIGVMSDTGKDGGTGPCDTFDGVAFEVIGHPEAKVIYYSADTIPVATAGTVTTASGRAAITELAPGPLVALKGTKAGCTVSFAKAPYTGRSPLEAGFLTLTPAYLRE